MKQIKFSITEELHERLRREARRRDRSESAVIRRALERELSRTDPTLRVIGDPLEASDVA